MGALENMRVRLRAIRDDEGITQGALAERMGLSAPYLSQVLSGKRGTRIPKLEDAVGRIGLTLSVLFASVASLSKKGGANPMDADVKSRLLREAGGENGDGAVDAVGALEAEIESLRAQLASHAKAYDTLTDQLRRLAKRRPRRRVPPSQAG